MEPQATDDHDGCFFLDKMDKVALQLRMLESISRLGEEHRVMVGIAHRLAGGI